MIFFNNKKYTIDFLNKVLSKNTAKRKKLQRKIKSINQESRNIYNYLTQLTNNECDLNE